jgi:hypothetical protein
MYMKYNTPVRVIAFSEIDYTAKSLVHIRKRDREPSRIPVSPPSKNKKRRSGASLEREGGGEGRGI